MLCVPFIQNIIPNETLHPGALRPLYITSLLQFLQPPRHPFTILQISPQHQPRQPAQADGWAFDNLERLADRNKVHHFPWGAMEMRLKHCGSHCWHNVRIQRLIGMLSPRGKRWTLFLSASCHNLPPIRPPPISLGNLQKVLYNIILTHYII